MTQPISQKIDQVLQEVVFSECEEISSDTQLQTYKF